jgi:hemerythrin-like domain-containing protein
VGAATDAIPITEHSRVLIAIHTAMRADSRRLVHAVTELDEGDRKQSAALGRAFAAVTELIHDHHWTEDDVIYPFLLEAVRTFEREAVRLEDDHVDLDAAMARVNARFRLLAHGVSPGVWSATQERLVEDATTFRDVLANHLEREEAVVIPAFESVLTEAEQRTLKREESKHTTYRHMSRAVPWVLANSTPEEADHLRAGAPALMKTVQDHVWERQFRHLMAPLYGASP